MTVSKFDEVKPYLLYIEAILSGFVGDAKDSFPHAWKEGSINEFSYWTTCGVFTVRQAVSLLLNYYRYVIEEYFFCCRKKTIFSSEHSKICAKILKIISDVENAVWQHNDYDITAGEGNCCNIVTMDKGSLTERTNEDDDVILAKTDVNRSSPSANSDKNVDNNRQDCDVHVESATDKYAAKTNVVLLSESIDDDVERIFLQEITENGDAICKGDNGDVEMEEALRVILEDPFEPINVDDICHTPAKTPQINERTQNNTHHAVQIQSTVNKLDNKHTEIAKFVDLVEQKWEKIAPNLSKEQEDMVRRSITHYHYMVSMESISAAQASDDIEHLLNSLSAEFIRR